MRRVASSSMADAQLRGGVITGQHVHVTCSGECCPFKLSPRRCEMQRAQRPAMVQAAAESAFSRVGKYDGGDRRQTPRAIQKLEA